MKTDCCSRFLSFIIVKCPSKDLLLIMYFGQRFYMPIKLKKIGFNS